MLRLYDERSAVAKVSRVCAERAAGSTTQEAWLRQLHGGLRAAAVAASREEREWWLRRLTQRVSDPEGSGPETNERIAKAIE